MISALRINPGPGDLWVMLSARELPRLRTRGRLGEHVEVSAEGRPLVVRLQFEDSLEDPDFAWFSWEPGGPARYTLPVIGATHTLPAMDNPLLSP